MTLEEYLKAQIHQLKQDDLHESKSLGYKTLLTKLARYKEQNPNDIRMVSILLIFHMRTTIEVLKDEGILEAYEDVLYKVRPKDKEKNRMNMNRKKRVLICQDTIEENRRLIKTVC